MASQSLKIVIKGDWEKAIRGLDGRLFKADLIRAITIANERIGRDAVARMRRAIRARHYLDNSPITVAIKGSSTPLVDRGDLFQALTYQVTQGGMGVTFGVRRGAKLASGADAVSVAMVLHEGATIRPTPAQRAALWAKVGAALSGRQSKVRRQAAAIIGGRSGGGGGSVVWVIPPRAFIAGPLSEPAFEEFVRAQYDQAIDAVMKRAGRR